MSALGYFEMRPAFTGETPLTVTCTIEGSGSIAGWTFSGQLYNPSGSEVAGAVTVAIANAANRIITITIAGQSTAGDHVVVVRRTDDSSQLVVAHGVVELTDASKP